ncbi:MAG TPA: Holliday junction resolvase RuvX [Burkholderiales bacterium]|nr:Holliday junction resolvase RuvX [Burkholderiales bacterium]
MPSRRPSSCTPATVLAFDFGEKRIGVAVGDRQLRIPHPLATIDAADNKRRFAAIAALLDEWQPALLVVGLPLRADGTEHEMTRRCRRFANQLKGRFGLPVELIDERLTSAVADSLLGASGVAARKRRTALDAVAAQQILLGYFETARPSAS